MENLVLHINGKEFKAEFSKENNSEILINGKKFHVELLKKFSQNIFSFAVNQKVLMVAWDYREDDNNFLIVDGFTHEVEISDETKQLLKKFLLDSTGAGSAAHAKVKAPMPGMVIKVMVEEGMPVKKGDKLLIIEAMKMENVISATISGAVKNIKAKEGVPVEKDVVLLEIFG